MANHPIQDDQKDPTPIDPTPTPPPSGSPPQLLKILLAEDNRVNQRLALLILKKWGYRAEVADNGVAVLQALEQQPYQVILMDVQMPDMDGIMATQAIHQRYAPPQWPYIIGITASAIPGDREVCLGAGMNAYLEKPIDEMQLVQALTDAQSWLHAKIPASPVPDSSVPPSAPEKTLNLDGILVLERALIENIRRMAGEQFPVFLADIVADFLTDTPDVIATLLRAMDQQDTETIHQSAHRLRSSSVNLGVARLAALGQHLEGLGKAGQPPDRAAYETALRIEYHLAQSALQDLVAEHSYCPDLPGFENLGGLG